MSSHPLRRLFATAFFASVAALAALTGLVPVAPAAQYGPTIEPLGPVEPVWIKDFNPNDTPAQRNSKNSCDSGHLADLPAKAFRDDQNRIDMPTPNGEPPRVRADGSITWQGSHRMLGPDLNNVQAEQKSIYPDRRLCTDPKSNITLTNPFEPNFVAGSGTPPAAEWPPPPGYEPWKPENFHDYEWVDSPWAIGDGRTVIALMHDNYKGYEDLNGDGVKMDDCTLPPPSPADPNPSVINYCWYAAVTTVKSTDGGATFGDSNDWTNVDPPFYSGPPHHLAISSPYRYESGQCCRQGVPEPTNVIKKGSFNYIMFRMNLPPDASPEPKQRTCVARSSNVEDPASWRGWDGNANDDSQGGYTVTFVNPYTYPFGGSDTPETHVCAPVDSPIFPRTVVYSRYFNQYMLIGDMTTNGVISVYYALSSDLISWTPPQLLEENAIYGSIIDDNDPAASSTSSERNFYQPDQKAYLYIGGRVRTPIKFKAMRWATGLADGCAGGFDGHTGTVTVATGRNYTGDDHAYLASSVGAVPAYSSFDKEDYPTSCGNPSPDPVQVRDGSDVWYGGAFTFPSTDFNTDGKPVNDVTFFRLENPNSAAGALSVRSDGRVHFVTDPNLAQSGDETELLQSGGQNGFPIANNGCWHYYEIHQKIGDASTTNEIWIDNQKQSTLQTAVDNFHGAPYDHYRAGIVAASGSTPFSLWTDEVGIGYVGPLSFNWCRGPNDTLP